MFKEFKRFVLRGNVVDLAVAVVVGAAFSAIVNSFVKDLITPLIGAVYSQEEFSKAYFSVHGSKFMYGDFINSILYFLIVAAVVFFLIVQPVNKLIALAKRDDDTQEPTTRKCPACLSEIPIKATRCAFCTSTFKPVKEKAPR